MQVHVEFINNELCKVKKALRKYLTKELSCSEFKMNYVVQKGRWFKKNLYQLDGSAQCANVVEVDVSVEIAPCEDCKTKTKVIVQDTNGVVANKRLVTSEALYSCN